MDHRIKNLFALAIGIVSLSGRSARNVQDLVRSARKRLSALARAQALTRSHGPRDDPQSTEPTTLNSLIRTIIAPHDNIEDAQGEELRSLDLTSRFPARRSPLWRLCCTNSGQIPQNMERSLRQKGRSRSSAPNTATFSPSHGRNAADQRLPPRQMAKGLAPLSLARRSRANLAGRFPATGGLKDRHPAIPSARAFDGDELDEAATTSMREARGRVVRS